MGLNQQESLEGVCVFLVIDGGDVGLFDGEDEKVFDIGADEFEEAVLFKIDAAVEKGHLA